MRELLRKKGGLSVGVGVGIAATLALLLSLGGVPASGLGRATPMSVHKAGNRKAAREAAGNLLRRLQLPPGSSRSASPPSEVGGELSQPPAVPGTPKLVDRTEWWLAPGSPDATLAWIEEHPPIGSRLAVRMESKQAGGGETRSLEFGLSPVRSVLASRALLVTATAMPDGSTALRVDAQVVWVVPRPASERIPAATRVLDVDFRLRQRVVKHVTVLRRVAVDRMVSVIERLPTVQPGIHGCPFMYSDARSLTLTFRASRGGRVLAEAIQHEPAGVCRPMSLKIGAVDQTPLSGGAAVIRVAEALTGPAAAGVSG